MKGLVEPGTGINCKVCVYGSTCNTGRGHGYHVKSCVQYTEGKHKTNAGRIRTMTDEELADVLLTHECRGCDWDGGFCGEAEIACRKEILLWLKEEVSE